MIYAIPKRVKSGLKPGIYTAEIIGGKYDPTSHIVSLDLVCTDEIANGHIEHIVFPLAKTHWLLNKLCKACGFDLNDSDVKITSKTGQNQLVGKVVYMAIRQNREVYDDGEIITENTEPFEFFNTTHQKTVPRMSGDPAFNDGVECSQFLREVVYARDREYTAIPDFIEA